MAETTLQVGVKVILRDIEGRILLLARTEQYLLPADTARAWDIPGGRISADEPLLDGLRRELREEINTDASLASLPALVTAQDIFVPTKGLHVVRLTFVHKVDTIGKIQLSDEHSEYGWFSLEETNDLAIEPYLRAALDMLLVSPAATA